MTNKKLISFATILSSVTGVAIVAAANKTGIVLGANAELQTYILFYENNSIFGDAGTITVDQETGIGYAQSRNTTLGFYNFDSFGSGSDFAVYNSNNYVGEGRNVINPQEGFDPLEYAAIYNTTPITGTIGGQILTNELLDSKNNNKTFSVYCILSDFPMYPGSDPLTEYFIDSDTPLGYFGIIFDTKYGVLYGENIENGEICSAIPENAGESITCFVADGSQDGVGGDYVRYLGSFEYFYMVFYGSVSIRSMAFSYFCEPMSEELIFEPYNN